jgi:hypothetical protein
VIGILGYWAQVPGGVKKDKGLPWKWRTYEEMGAAAGYSISTIARAVKQLKSHRLIETKRMFNPSKPGQTVNGFRLLAKGYEIVRLAIPIGASGSLEEASDNVSDHASTGGGPNQNAMSQQQLTFKELQKHNYASCFGKKEEKGEPDNSASYPQSDDRVMTLEEVASALGKTLD